MLLTLALLLAEADLIAMAKAAPMTEGPLYAYTLEYDDGNIKAVGRVDPSQPKGSRITVLEPPEETWSDDFRDDIEDLDEDSNGKIFCDEYARQIPDNAVPIDETATTVIYKFAPKPRPGKKNDEKIMPHLTATAELDKSDGALLALRLWSEKPFKPIVIAKVDSFTLDLKCERAPDGRTYQAALDMAVKASAFFKGFDENVSQRITNLERVQ